MLIKSVPFLLAAVGFYACSKSSQRPASTLASFTLDELKTSEKDPAWESVAVRMQRLAPTEGEIKKDFARKSFSSGKIEDVSVEVEYGTYGISLDYTDANRKTVYQVCEAFREKTYEINQPKFQTEIKICRETASGEEKPIGVVTVKPTSEVSITPTFYDPNDPEQGAGPGGNATISGNPFSGAALFVNPRYAADVKASAAKESADIAAKMNKVAGISTALWIDRIAKIKEVSATIAQAQAEQKKSQKPALVTIVVYNLPERDCSASSSAGELSAADDGMNKYKTMYIDEIAKMLKQYSDLKFAAIIEPDSLPNMATNMGVSKCVGAAPLYKEGVAYAIKKLSLPHVALYLDTAHGGWLGWPDNRRKMALIFKEVLDLAGGSHMIRGFASNVSNYSPLKQANPDPNPESFYESNPARDELSFAKLLAQDLSAAGLKNVNFIIDTSRNGKAKSRDIWGSWCNVKAAGIGERPRVAPAPGIDAYVWVKPPGESDGVSSSDAPRFDTSCQSNDSMLEAPQAGEWFHKHFKSLVINATPAL